MGDERRGARHRGRWLRPRDSFVSEPTRKYGPKYGDMNRVVYADRTCEPSELGQVNIWAAHDQGEWNVVQFRF
jgi:hypothetical protein